MNAVAEISTGRLRQVFGAHPSGVVFVAGLVDGRPVGLAASTFTSVSLEPALVSVSVGHSSTTWPVLRRAPRLGLSVLAGDQAALVSQLAAANGDRFASVDWWTTLAGGVVLDGVAAWFEVSVAEHFPAGDHDIVVLAVHALDVAEDVSPLVFHASRFTQVRQ